jgi:predicted transcriptional regulator
MTTNITRLRQLLTAQTIPTAAKATGISERTLYRIKAGEDFTVTTLEKLEKWATGKRVPAQ